MHPHCSVVVRTASRAAAGEFACRQPSAVNYYARNVLESVRMTET